MTRNGPPSVVMVCVIGHGVLCPTRHRLHDWRKQGRAAAGSNRIDGSGDRRQLRLNPDPQVQQINRIKPVATSNGAEGKVQMTNKIISSQCKYHSSP